MTALKHTILPLLLVLLAGATIIAGNDDATNPAPPSSAPAEIQWVSYDVGLQRAAAEKKHVLIDFTAKWCGFCKKMDRETFSRPEVIAMINENFVPVKVDGDSQKELDVNGYKVTEANLAKKEFGVRGYPTFWFLKSDGTRLGMISGYRPADVMIEALTYVKDEQYDTTKVEAPKSNP